MRILLIHIMLFVTTFSFGQRIHLEVGGNLEFGDTFFDKPAWIQNAKFTEIHSLGLNGLLRVSKRKFATQINVGFMKAMDQFIRFKDGNTATTYINLNSFPLGVLESFYLIKKPEKKLDIQIGLINSFYLNKVVFAPSSQIVNAWYLGGRGALNYTYHSFMCGVYYDHTIRSQYTIQQPTAIFGASIGLIY